MEELEPSLYERLLTEGLKAQLDELAESFPAERRALRAAEAPDRIAWQLSRQIELEARERNPHPSVYQSTPSSRRDTLMSPTMLNL